MHIMSESEIYKQEVSSPGEEGSSNGQQPAKRRRKTGWDVEPPTASSSSIFAAMATPPTMSSSSSLVTSPLETNVSPAARNPQQLIQQILAKPSIASIVSSAKPPAHRIYVGSLNYDLREADVIKLFSVFGTVTKCDMSFEPATGKSKGFCFVEFSEPQHAEAAMIMNGLDIAGRKIKVGRPSQGSTAFSHTAPVQINQFANIPSSLPIASPPSLVVSHPPSVPPPLHIPSSTFVTVSNIKIPFPMQEVQDIFSLHGSIKVVKKLVAMRKDPKEYYDLLIEYHEAKDASAAVRLINGHVLSGSAIEVQPITIENAIDLMMKSAEQSTCKSVLLEHMVTVADTLDPALKDEIAVEARNYGNLIDIDITVVDKEKDIAHVTLKYADAADATKASKALGNRLFAGRRIKATLIA